MGAGRRASKRWAPGVQSALEVACSGAYEGAKLGEGCGVVSGPCSNRNHLRKAGRGHGGAQLALLPAGGWLAKWGKMAASLWGAGWSPASGQPPHGSTPWRNQD